MQLNKFWGAYHNAQANVVYLSRRDLDFSYLHASVYYSVNGVFITDLEGQTGRM